MTSLLFLDDILSLHEKLQHLLIHNQNLDHFVWKPDSFEFNQMVNTFHVKLPRAPIHSNWRCYINKMQAEYNEAIFFAYWHFKSAVNVKKNNAALHIEIDQRLLII